jgi:hypothetical protein
MFDDKLRYSKKDCFDLGNFYGCVAKQPSSDFFFFFVVVVFQPFPSKEACPFIRNVKFANTTDIQTCNVKSDLTCANQIKLV